MKAGSKLRKGALRDSDVPRVLVFFAFLAVSVVLAAALPLVYDDVGYAESLVALAMPFVALGVWDSAFSRRWLRTVALVVVPLALAYFDWSYAAFAAMLLPGSVGVSGASDLLLRRFAPSILDSVEHGAVRPDRTPADRAVSFIFDIPPGMDARNIRINGTIRRESIPWRQLGRSMLPVLVPTTLIWMIAVCAMGPRDPVSTALLPVVAVSLYALVMFQAVHVIGTMGVRVESSGREFRIFDGLIGTSLRMLVPAVVALAVVVLVESHGWGALAVVIGSAASGAAVCLLSVWSYSDRGEAEFVEGFHAEWSRSHPVDFYSDIDGKDSRSRMEDGVPGTPRRPADFCFQKN